MPVPGCLHPCSCSLHKLAWAFPCRPHLKQPSRERFGDKRLHQGGQGGEGSRSSGGGGHSLYLEKQQSSGQGNAHSHCSSGCAHVLPGKGPVSLPGQAWTSRGRLTLPPCVLLSISSKCRAGAPGANGLRCPTAGTQGWVWDAAGSTCPPREAGCALACVAGSARVVRHAPPWPSARWHLAHLVALKLPSGFQATEEQVGNPGLNRPTYPPHPEQGQDPQVPGWMPALSTQPFQDV